MIRGTTAARFAALLGVAMVALAACGGSGAGAGPQAGQPMTIRVGVLPIQDVAPIYLGIEKGFFKRQGLTVNLQVMQGGAAVASAVLGGSLDLGFAAPVNLILAKDQGLPVKIVAPGNNASTDPDHAWSAIMVSADSPIKTVKDLAGKTVAANALKGVNELATDAIVMKAGISPSSLKTVPVDFPDMPAALDQKRVDAVGVPEPFLTAIKAKGGRIVTPLFAGFIPGMSVGSYFTTDREIQQHPAVVTAFAKAIGRSLAYANTHPDDVRRVVGTYTKIPPDLLKVMVLSTYETKLNVPSIQRSEQLMKQLGWIKSDVDVHGLIWSGASV
jgi:NitT/TauT family transport system substrate-binding protein